MPALRQLLNIVKHMVKVATNRLDRAKVLSDIHRICDINKLIISSLVTCHQLSVTVAAHVNIPLHPDLLIDKCYSHQEVYNI